MLTQTKYFLPQITLQKSVKQFTITKYNNNNQQCLTQQLIMNNFNESQPIKPNPFQSLTQTFLSIKNKETTYFSTLQNKCTQIQQTITILQQTIRQLQQKIKYNMENNMNNKLSQIRDRQKQFIIVELENKVKRLEEYQEYIQNIVGDKDNIIGQLHNKCQALQSENVDMKQQLQRKIKQVKQLIKANTSLKLAQAIQSNKPNPSSSSTTLSQQIIKKQKVYIQNQHYSQLQQKLKQMQDCLNDEIQQYKQKNDNLLQQISLLQKQLHKQSQNNKKMYQLQLKIRKLSQQNKQLQQQYTNQITLNNTNEIKFHKKINQLKNQLQQNKKQSKNILKQVQKQLLELTTTILGNNKSTIFIGINNIGQQFRQLTKQILKYHKKQNNVIIYQKDTQIEELKINLEQSKNKIKQLSAIIEKNKNNKNQLFIGLNANNSNKNNSRTDIENKQKQKDKQAQKQKQKQKANNQKFQKCEQKIKQLRALIQDKQKQVNELRKKYDDKQNKYSQRILQLQANLADKQMLVQYQQQKYIQTHAAQIEIQRRKIANMDRELGRNKQKIKQLQGQKQQIRGKHRQSQQKLVMKQKVIRDLQRKQRQNMDKFAKLQRKSQQKHDQNNKIITSKSKTIQQLITKNQSLQTQLKIIKQKLKISQFNIASMKEITIQTQKKQNKTNTQQIQLEFKIEKQRNKIEKQRNQIEITRLKEQMEQIKDQWQYKNKEMIKKQQKMNQLILQLNKLQNQNKLLKNQAQILKQTTEKLKQSAQKRNNFTQLKQEYQKRQKLLKNQGQKIITQIKATNKQLNAQNKRLIQHINYLKQNNQSKKLTQQINYLKQNNQSLKNQLVLKEQQKTKIAAQRFKDSQRQHKLKSNYQKQIQQLSLKIAKLNDNLTLENNRKIQSKLLKNKKPFKGTESVQYLQFGIVTDSVEKKEQGINTIDMFALQAQQNGGMNRILDLGDSELGVLESNNQESALRNSNLFINLNQNAPNDDVFQICDENQQVNFGQNAIKIQFRQIFTGLRIQIQKIFDQQQISFGLSKLLPQGFQDDYYDLMSYIRQKISQNKVHEISFIMADQGNQQDIDNSFQMPFVLDRRLSQGNQNLHKIIQQKQDMIHSLMNERNSQQHTINQLTMQKQELQQQNQNRFMNQCNVYKRQIKQHKKNIDILQMDFQSMKNIIRNILQAYSQNQDMEDDFRQSMTLYARVGKLSEKQRSKINYHIQRYLKIKGLEDEE